MLKNEITADELAALRATHGEANVKVYEVATNDNIEDNIEVAVLVPKRQIVGKFQQYYNTDRNKASEVLVNACLLTSKDEAKNNDYIFNGALMAISDLIPVSNATLKNK